MLSGGAVARRRRGGRGGARLSEWSRFNDRKAADATVAELKAEVASARDEARAALSAAIDQKTLSTANASVYLIVVNGRCAARRSSSIATRACWRLRVIRPSRSLDDPKADVRILNRDLKGPIRVKSKRVHAGFKAFRI